MKKLFSKEKNKIMRTTIFLVLVLLYSINIFESDIFVDLNVIPGTVPNIEFFEHRILFDDSGNYAFDMYEHFRVQMIINPSRLNVSPQFTINIYRLVAQTYKRIWIFLPNPFTFAAKKKS